MSGLIDVIGILLLFALVSFFVVLFHELGHALMVLAFSEGDVNIYIGSYGEVNNSLQVRTGRLTTHIKYNPVKWRRGICFPPNAQFLQIIKLYMWRPVLYCLYCQALLLF